MRSVVRPGKATDLAHLHKAATKIVNRYLHHCGGESHGYDWKPTEDYLRDQILWELERTVKRARREGARR